MSKLAGKSAEARAMLFTAMITGVLLVTAQSAEAKGRQGDKSRQTYRIVGELSDADLIALWPPARRMASNDPEMRTGRRYYRAFRAGGRIPLGEWVPDSSRSRADGRLVEDEQRLRLQRDANDRDSDGVPDQEDHHPWDRNRW